MFAAADLDALMQAVLDHPDDDSPRVVIADWFEENGYQQRADFIRVQLRIAKLKFGNDEWMDLVTLQNAIYGQSRDARSNCRRWFVDVHDAIGGINCYRGFPRDLYCSTEFWLANARPIMRANPLASVHLIDSRTEFEFICDHNGAWTLRHVGENRSGMISEWRDLLFSRGQMIDSLPAGTVTRATWEEIAEKMRRLGPIGPTQGTRTRLNHRVARSIMPPVRDTGTLRRSLP